MPFFCPLETWAPMNYKWAVMVCPSFLLLLLLFFAHCIQSPFFSFSSSSSSSFLLFIQKRASNKEITKSPSTLCREGWDGHLYHQSQLSQASSSWGILFPKKSSIEMINSLKHKFFYIYLYVVIHVPPTWAELEKKKRERAATQKQAATTTSSFSFSSTSSSSYTCAEFYECRFASGYG